MFGSDVVDIEVEDNPVKLVDADVAGGSALIVHVSS